mmetsp:Transcript_25529/g.33368  ORF Transcript_25529/g.33368 Transcript_25529/m.33368 type:complete len:207 (-) Transcript_25529:317-937(-)|eukprot:CAMPEP_0117757652 /NCGR_PEP_ID=MMETSP0947-20121206/14868_1 /TAXON_ID=44440 /ORGANISM="Chattonella subsalsa, Strain CCMP2191" /LENGTH=206 /DNA_ID=CAMNT_0005577605 /DNA_START=152 /DNA_END=772 /DNA_ORIENTATION=-
MVDCEYDYDSDYGDFLCLKCDRYFKSLNAINQHFDSSSKHQMRSFKCPYCDKSFAKMSSVANHVESGFCPKLEVSHNGIYNKVQQMERHAGKRNLVTVPLIDNDGGYSTQSFSSIPVNKLAENCFSHGRYHCPYNDCSRDFGSPSNLFSHVNSKRHVPPAYKCVGCSKRFTALNGLFTHWEYGCTNRATAADAVAMLSQGMRQLTF